MIIESPTVLPFDVMSQKPDSESQGRLNPREGILHASPYFRPSSSARKTELSASSPCLPAYLPDPRRSEKLKERSTGTTRDAPVRCVVALRSFCGACDAFALLRSGGLLHPLYLQCAIFREIVRRPMDTKDAQGASTIVAIREAAAHASTYLQMLASSTSSEDLRSVVR